MGHVDLSIGTSNACLGLSEAETGDNLLRPMAELNALIIINVIFEVNSYFFFADGASERVVFRKVGFLIFSRFLRGVILK